MRIMTYVANEWEERYGETASRLRSKLEKAGFSVSPTGPWLCGGAVRRAMLGLPLDSDLDLFFPNEDALAAVRGEHKWKANSSCESAECNGVTVQLIRIAWYPTIADVLESFDFTICQFGYDGDSFHVGEWALVDATRKRLAVHKITHAVSSVRRMLKYGRQGFRVCNGAISSLLTEIERNPESKASDILYVD